MKTKKYHYFYKITNTINNKYYYGVHSTDNLNDGYMGSGTAIRMAEKKYGIEFFEKEILKYFDTAEEAYDYEKFVVNETLVRDQNCYNQKQGGLGFNSEGLATVKDKDGNTFLVPTDDERLKSGELVGHTKGYQKYLDENGNIYFLRKDDELVKSGKVFGFTKNKAVYVDKEGNRKLLNIDDERIKKGEVVSFSKNMILVKDKENNFQTVDKNDYRYISGELIPIWTGLAHSEESKEKMRETHKKNKDQVGVKNSRYGTCWITNGIEDKSIDKEDAESYIKNGWYYGRCINKDNIKYETDDKIDKERLLKLRNEGKSWVEIAKEFKVGKNSLIRYRKRHNIE